MQTTTSSNPALKSKSSVIPSNKKSRKSTVSVSLPKTKTGSSKGKKSAPIVESINKQSLILSLMQRPEGVSMPELIKATGWLAHSLRGFISGSLRKKLALSVVRFNSETGESCYRIEAPATMVAVDAVSQ